jgi:formyl-CoA transferase
MMTENNNDSLLGGIRVIDCGQLIAGPFAATLLGEFGAEVIKVEQPGEGDNIRAVGPLYNEFPIWWAVEGRNKKSVTIDLRKAAGQRVFKKLVSVSDVLVENYLPGTMAKWNLSDEELRSVNKDIVIIHVSGFGQTGPYMNRYGFDRIALAVGGILHLCGYPDAPPVRPGVALVDYVAGIFGALSAMMALYYRDARGKVAQSVDIALYECAFRILDYYVIDFALRQATRERSGNLHPVSAPANTYTTKDNQWLVLASANDRVFRRLVRLMEREDLLEDPRFSTMRSRSLYHQKEIDGIVAEWISKQTFEEIFPKLIERGIPAAPIYNIQNIFEDPHYRERGIICEIDDPTLGKVKMQGVVPRFSATPGKVTSIGPRLGEHTSQILSELLGFTAEEIADMKKDNVI